jgi:hypothetical protein
MNTQSISDSAVTKATGRSWEEWFALLNNVGAEQLSHKEIAHKLYSEHEVEGWWAQNITVEFERLIGRRAHGQRQDGDYEISVNKTFLGTMDRALAAWQALVGDASVFDGVVFSSEPATSKTDKWRYWRVSLADGTRVNVIINQKDAEKAQLSVQHRKLQSKDDAERWKSYWKSYLLAL